jgi:hypothetical protein
MPHFVASGGHYDPGRGYLRENVAVPYLDTDPHAGQLPPYGNEDQLAPQPPRRWRCPDTYQIICAGLDGRFGADGKRTEPEVTFRYTRTAANFSPADYDNITNFTETGTLEDELWPVQLDVSGAVEVVPPEREAVGPLRFTGLVVEMDSAGERLAGLVDHGNLQSARLGDGDAGRGEHSGQRDHPQ